MGIEPTEGWLECQGCNQIFKGLVLIYVIDSDCPDKNT